MKYNEATLRYFENPPAAGRLEGAGVVTGAAGSRAQGAWVSFDLLLAAGEVTAARFRAFGCPHTIAATAWVAEHAPGARAGSPLPRPVAGLAAMFDVPAEKRGRLLVVEDAWRAAMAGAHA